MKLIRKVFSNTAGIKKKGYNVPGYEAYCLIFEGTLRPQTPHEAWVKEAGV